MIQFEIPYNFDPYYVDTLKNCNLINDYIKYIYIAPFKDDYTTIIRHDVYGAKFLTREEYVKHMQKIRYYFNGKMQLLLQKKDKLMPLETLKWYIDIGFTAFCCGNVEQAKMIKNYDPSLTVIGSIVLHVTNQDILENKDYQNFFDVFVLDFSYGRSLTKIKNMPDTKKYMILANSTCHVNCDGDHHWNVTKEFAKIHCPGRYPREHQNFNDTVLIRPMDLHFFEPYIDTFKMQDRSWPTWSIINDLIMYETDYTTYPGIQYDEGMYDTRDY